jgi:pimeloyl-ACP methyl ester carboxylesterase
MECSGLDVPVDPARPDGLRFTLRLGRLPVLDPTQRKGVLLFIPGGPGAGIAKIIGGDNGRAQHVDEFRRQWDVVSFDPRGIERSSCKPDARLQSPRDGHPPPPNSGDRACQCGVHRKLPEAAELMRYLSAMDTAADVEQIRCA